MGKLETNLTLTLMVIGQGQNHKLLRYVKWGSENGQKLSFDLFEPEMTMTLTLNINRSNHKLVAYVEGVQN